jgi:hypothetical protein
MFTIIQKTSYNIKNEINTVENTIQFNTIIYLKQRNNL